MRGLRIGFEMKFSEAPKVTGAMHEMAETLRLDHLFVVCPTTRAYPVERHITVLPASEIPGLRDRVAGSPDRALHSADRTKPLQTQVGMQQVQTGTDVPPRRHAGQGSQPARDRPLPSARTDNPRGDDAGRLHLVQVDYKDHDSPHSERLLWELEPGRELLEPSRLPRVRDSSSR